VSHPAVEFCNYQEGIEITEWFLGHLDERVIIPQFGGGKKFS
jgi:hypothetical protein